MFRKVKAIIYKDGSWIAITGKFHQWGLSFDQDQGSSWNYSIAIIELNDGSVVEALPNKVTFLD